MIALSRNSGTVFVSKISNQKKPQQGDYDMQRLCVFYATVTVESSSRRNVSIMIALSPNSGTAFVSKLCKNEIAEVMRLLCGYDARATLFTPRLRLRVVAVGMFP